MSPSGKAPDFDSGIRRFESCHPSQKKARCRRAFSILKAQKRVAKPKTLCYNSSSLFAEAKSAYDPLAQPVEQLPFKQWVRGSSPRRVTKKPDTHPGIWFFAYPPEGLEPSNAACRWHTAWPRLDGANTLRREKPGGNESPTGHQETRYPSGYLVSCISPRGARTIKLCKGDHRSPVCERAPGSAGRSVTAPTPSFRIKRLSTYACSILLTPDVTLAKLHANRKLRIIPAENPCFLLKNKSSSGMIEYTISPERIWSR